MAIKLSTVLSSLFYLLPLYLFVLAPLLRQFFPSEESPSSPSTTDYFGADTDADDLAPSPALNLLDDTFISIDDGLTPDCPLDPAYRIHLLSRTPLVIYIEGFLTPTEADHLVDIRYSPSPPSSPLTPH
jgi:prolyl 4-hydroxylase